MLKLRGWLEAYFEFGRLGTNWRTEMIAGLTTFITMAYIVAVNPSILQQAGMPYAAVVWATCLSAAYGSLAMGLGARVPLALAPGMGLNAYFAYGVVMGRHVPWPTALGAVLLSGLAFLLLTLLGVRKFLLAGIPAELYAAVSAGVGIFLAYLGLRSAGLLVPNAATVLALGNLRDGKVVLACFGLLLTTVLMAKRVPAAIFISVLVTTAVAAGLGFSHWHPTAYRWSDVSATVFHADVRSSFRLGLLEIVFVFLFVDFFDNVGTLVAVGKKAGLIRESVREMPRLTNIFLADSTATIFSALAGTSTTVTYVESAAGVEAGGRSGVTAVLVGCLFLLSLLATPVLGAIPASATAPVLIVVGGLMMGSLGEIQWRDPSVALPSVLTVLMIPLTYSIANGLAFGFIAFVSLKLATGRGREVHWMTYILSVLFVLRFVYLGSNS